MGIHLCSGTRNTKPRSPVDSTDDEEFSNGDKRPPPSLTESRLRVLHSANMERMKKNSNDNPRTGQIDKSSLVLPGSNWTSLIHPGQRNRRAMSAPLNSSPKVSDVSEEDIINRKALMKKQIKEVLKPYLFLNELCRLDRELDALCDGLLANALSSEPLSNQMDDVKSYIEESSSIFSGNRESCNIDLERSTPAVSEHQEVILMSNEPLGEEIRKSLAFTSKIDRLKKKSAKISAEIARLEKQNADCILSRECNYSLMRSREHEISRLKRLDNITWEQISSSISLLKAEIKPPVTDEHKREIHGRATTNRPYSSSTPPPRQICVSSVDLTTEEGKSSAKLAGLSTQEPEQSRATLWSNNSQGTVSCGRNQEKRKISVSSRTDGAIINDGGPHSKCYNEEFLNDTNLELVQMP